MPTKSKFQNWSDVVTANQDYGQRMAGDVAARTAKDAGAASDAFGKYRQQAFGDYQQGATAPGQAATASYGDAYKAMQKARQSQGLAQSNEGRQALMSSGGKRATWMDAALAGNYAQKQNGAWDALQKQFTGDEQWRKGLEGENTARQQRQQSLTAANMAEYNQRKQAEDAAKRELAEAESGYGFYRGGSAPSGGVLDMDVGGVERGSEAWKNLMDTKWGGVLAGPGFGTGAGGGMMESGGSKESRYGEKKAKYESAGAKAKARYEKALKDYRDKMNLQARR